MIPPPTTSSRPGTSSSASAPVLSMMRGSSGRNGSEIALDPTAMIALSKPIVVSPTVSTWSEANVASPWTTVTLRCLARPARPPVSRPTTESFHAPSAARSICGSPNEMPCSAISSVSATTFAACSSALDGMHPTFRQTPPSAS